MTEGVEPNVAEVAAKLTKAQADVMRLLGPGESRRPVLFYSDVANRLCVATKERPALITKARVPGRGNVYSARPFGLAVRAHLTGERP